VRNRRFNRRKGGAPRCKRLAPGAQAHHDILILARRAAGWPWDAIAREAGLSGRGAQEAAAKV
jgi:hypothetical protein